MRRKDGYWIAAILVLLGMPGVSCGSDDSPSNEGVAAKAGAGHDATAGNSGTGGSLSEGGDSVDGAKDKDSGEEAEPGDATGEKWVGDGIHCGDKSCTDGTVCCMAGTDQSCTESSECVGDFQAQCDSKEDCASGLCCGGPNASATECKEGSCDPLSKICNGDHDCDCGFYCCPFEKLGWKSNYCSAAPCI